MTTSTQLSMSTAERLLAIEEIKQVKNRYAYSADRHDWDEFASVFAPDAVFDESDFPGALQPFTKEPVSSTIAAYLEEFLFRDRLANRGWRCHTREAYRHQR